MIQSFKEAEGAEEKTETQDQNGKEELAVLFGWKGLKVVDEEENIFSANVQVIAQCNEHANTHRHHLKR